MQARGFPLWGFQNPTKGPIDFLRVAPHIQGLGRGLPTPPRYAPGAGLCSPPPSSK